MKAFAVAALFFISMTLRAEGPPAVRPPSADLLEDKRPRLFTSEDKVVIRDAAEAIGLKPFSYFEGKKEFTLDEFKSQLHARVELETTALKLEESRSAILVQALNGAKKSDDVSAAVKASGRRAEGAVEAHFAQDKLNLVKPYTDFKAKVTADLTRLDPKLYPGLIKSMQDELIDRTKKHEAALAEVEETKQARLKQTKDFYESLTKQIADVMAGKDTKAAMAEWKKQRAALEKRVEALTAAELLLLKKEVELLKYGKKLSDSVGKYRAAEFSEMRRDWLRKFDDTLTTEITKKYTTDFFTKGAGQWGFIEDMDRRFGNLKAGEPFLEQYKGIKDKETEGKGKPSGGRNSGGSVRPGAGGTHGGQ